MILPIQYHRQDDRLKCGSACAQMVLESLSPGSALIRQQILYDDSRLDTPAGELPLWATPHDGLVDIIGQMQAAIRHVIGVGAGCLVPEFYQAGFTAFINEILMCEIAAEIDDANQYAFTAGLFWQGRIFVGADIGDRIM